MSFPITTVADYLDDWRRRLRQVRRVLAPDPPPVPPPVRSRPQRPKRPGGDSRYRGVFLYRPTGRWTASIRYQSKLHTCGAFDTEIEAARAYDAKVRELIGPTALINFPEGG